MLTNNDLHLPLDTMLDHIPYRKSVVYIAILYSLIFFIFRNHDLSLVFFAQRLVPVILGIHLVAGYLHGREVGAGFVSYPADANPFGRLFLFIVGIFILTAVIFV